jgi:hypothetical protein
MSPSRAAKPPYWAISALRRGGKTSGRSKFHHCLIEIARILTTEQLLRRIPHAFAGRLGAAEQARDHTLNVPVHHGNRLAKCNAGDRGGGISADARKSFEFAGSAWKFASMTANNLSGSGVQVSRSTVVSQAAPFSQDRRFPRRSQLPH